MIDRSRIIDAVHGAMEAHAGVFAGWEGGSAAFGALDRYSDIDLMFLVDPAVPPPDLFEAAEGAMESLSRILGCYHEPPGVWEGITHRIYRLEATDEYLLIDLALLRADATDHFLEVERHGHGVPLFDKGDWLRPRPVDPEALAAKAARRRQELTTWFPMSQNFVVKAIRRGHAVEAAARYMAFTLRPLVDLLRMRHCPLRWDFGLRYLDRDLPPDVHDRIRALVFPQDVADLEAKHAEAAAWALALLKADSFNKVEIES